MGKDSAVPVPALIGGIQRTEVQMAAFPDSYILKVLLAPVTPGCGFDAVARRWRKVLDPYRPELYYMRGPGPKWRKKYGHRIDAGCG
jgi:hypothetical protein